MFIILGINYLQQNFTHQQRYIIVAVLSLFLPFYISVGIILLLTLRLLWKGEIQNAYRKEPINKLLLFFCGLSMIVSLFYKNYLGMCISFFILIAGLFVIYYKEHITPELFEFITNIIVLLSIFAVLHMSFVVLYIFLCDSFVISIDNLNLT